MQIQVFQISVSSGAEAMEEVNKFLRSHRVLQVDRHFSPEGGYWTLLVTYQEGDALRDAPVAAARGARKDYREELSEEAFGRFAHYRDVRRELARRQAVPPYVIFTDEELARLAEAGTLTPESMVAIKGIGKSRVEKYGALFIQAVAEQTATANAGSQEDKA